MHRYASATPEARELVAELEFVWDQVRDNSNDNGERGGGAMEDTGFTRIRTHERHAHEDGTGLRVMRPMSEQDEDEEEDVDVEDENDRYRHRYDDRPPQGARHHNDDDDDDASASASSIREQAEDGRPVPRALGAARNDTDWRRRVESALVKMTAEVAALREQLEARRLFSGRLRRRGGLAAWVLGFLGGAARHVLVDAVVVGVVLLAVRRREGQLGEGDVREWGRLVAAFLRGWLSRVGAGTAGGSARRLETDGGSGSGSGVTGKDI